MAHRKDKPCSECGMHYCDHPEPTPPATAEMPECVRCGQSEDKCPSARTRTKNAALRAELASLRAKLAEAENDKALLTGMLQSARQHTEKAEAKLAEWEAAGRVLVKECRAHRWNVDPGHDEEIDEAIRATNDNELASRLVAEAGGEHG